jgi:hypothetical protein
VSALSGRNKLIEWYSTEVLLGTGIELSDVTWKHVTQNSNCHQASQSERVARHRDTLIIEVLNCNKSNDPNCFHFFGWLVATLAGWGSTLNRIEVPYHTSLRIKARTGLIRVNQGSSSEITSA